MLIRLVGRFPVFLYGLRLPVMSISVLSRLRFSSLLNLRSLPKFPGLSLLLRTKLVRLFLLARSLCPICFNSLLSPRRPFAGEWIEIKMKVRCVLCVLLIFLGSIVFPFSVLAASSVHFSVPEPSADPYNKYFVIGDRLFQCHIATTRINYSTGVTVPRTGYDASTSYTMDAISGYLSVSRPDSNTTKVSIVWYNYTELPVDIYFIRFNQSGGSATYFDHVVVPALTVSGSVQTPGTFTFSASFSASDPGIWQSGFVLDGSSSYSLLPVTWADTIDYSTDFSALNSLLSTWSSSDQDFHTAVETLLNGMADSESSFFSWFKSTYYNSLTGYWDRALNQLLFANAYLANIYQALGGGEEQTTIEGESELYQGIGDLHDSESGYLSRVDDNNDSLNIYADSALTGADQRLLPGFAFVKWMFDWVVSFPAISILITFVLVFGVLVLITGKKVQR